MKRKLGLLLVLLTVLLITMSVTAFAEKNSLDNFIRTRTYENQFADVSTTDWYATSVSQAYEYGLVSGTSQARYNPKGNVSVVEAIVLACRLNNIYCDNNEKFEAGAVWYQPYVDYAIENKIIEKEFENYNAPATRREFVKILSSALPADEFSAINNVSEIPDVTSDEKNIYMFYNAGILAGSDKYGTFNPTSNIQRSEVAAIIVRIADRTQRKEFVLEKKPIEATGISLDITSLKMDQGDKKAVKATVWPVAATNRSATYTSSNTSVATVSSSGEILAVGAGNVTITATTHNGKKAECKVTVEKVVASFSGHGDKVITNVNIPAGSHYAEVTHDGERLFTSKIYYGEKSYHNFSTNGLYKFSAQTALYNNGNVAVNNGMLEVEADGNWTVKIKPVSGTTTTNVKGRGELVTGVFVAKSSRVVVNLSHDGESNFMAKVIKYNGTKSYHYESLANEIGKYSGQKIINLTPGEKYYFYVIADGNWSIDFGEGESVTTYTLPTIPASGGSTSGGGSGNQGSANQGGANDKDDDKRFSYTDVLDLNEYAAESTKACNNATKESLNAYKNSTLASLYVAKALNYASSAKREMESVIKLLKSKVEITFESGDTLLEKAEEALDAIENVIDYDVEDGDIIYFQWLCGTAAGKALIVEQASVELLQAF
ncbi:MAG: hypothetical protein E7598_05180 [Ruminococcaceae bacterium]|nr:hypothetical protein [Oscillospiraceae bacterium]